MKFLPVTWRLHTICHCWSYHECRLQSEVIRPKKRFVLLRVLQLDIIERQKPINSAVNLISPTTSSELISRILWLFNGFVSLTGFWFRFCHFSSLGRPTWYVGRYISAAVLFLPALRLGEPCVGRSSNLYTGGSVRCDTTSKYRNISTPPLLFTVGQKVRFWPYSPTTLEF